MTVELTQLENVKRLLFSIPLKPLQGERFQPTGFPKLGAATYQTKEGQSLLVESTQSMANRLELTIWDDAHHDVKTELQGLSHVRVLRQGNFLTDTILESHRLNSPYLLEGSNQTFHDAIKASLGGLVEGPIDRGNLSEVLLRYDISSLLHGVFLAKKDLAGGRLRVSRAISAFIEADGVRVVASGGVKNDHVKLSDDTSSGFGNVPFARDEFTADRVTLYVNLDLAQVRGYGLGEDVERLLILLAMYKLRVLLDGDLRLRTACDLMVATDSITADTPSGFALPTQKDLQGDLQLAIAACADRMTVTEVVFNDELKKGKTEKNPEENAASGEDNADTDENSEN